jgi:large repetitive protein
MKQNYTTKMYFGFSSVLTAFFTVVFALFFSWNGTAQTDSKASMIAGSGSGSMALNAQVTCNGGPCDAIRWTGGGSWNLDGSVNDAPNAPAPNGIVRCGSAAETQSNVSTNSCYNSSAQQILVNGIPCIDPSLQDYNTNVINPIEGQTMIWFNWDVRAYANEFQIQVNNPNQVIGWALFYSPIPTTSVGPNGLSGDCSNISPVINNDPQFAGMNYILCGTQSSNTWNTIPVPDFPLTSNYYLAVWRQGGGAFSLNNFKARFGCGEIPNCAVDITDVETTCNDDGTYTAAITVFGINGEYKASDANAINPNSNSICLTNQGVGGPISGILYLTYPVGTPYNITVSEVSPSTIGGCNNPDNSASCTDVASGDSPLCCSLEVICPPTNTFNISCIGDVPPVDPSQFTIVNPCGAIDISSEIVVNDGDGCPGNAKTITRVYTVTDGTTTVTCEDVFIIENNVAPEFDQEPADVTVQCIADVPAPTALGYVDNCLGDGSVMPTDMSNGETCPEVITRTWSYTDPCGITITASQLITINDNINPVIVPVANVNLQECNADWPSLSTTWSDNCGGSGTINGVPGDVMTDGCTQSLVYTFSVTDACGNPASTNTTVTRTFDVTAPSIDAPANFALQGCNGNWPELTANWTDNCSEGGVLNGVAGEVVTNGCSQSRVYTFSVTDACGNSSSATTTVTRTFDVTAPSIDAPANFALQGCNGNWPELTANWTDNCSEGGVINGVAGEVVTNGCSQSRVYTFSITDDCGNNSSATTTVTRTFDVTAPAIDAPANFALQGCNGNWPELTANWTDNCSEGGVINGVAGEVVTNGCSQSRVYTFSVTDACGNSSSATTTVTRTFDVTAPAIDAPANFALQGCNGNWPELTANWTDNCSEGGIINGVAGEVVTNGCSQSRVYTFSVTDACGNSSSATTTVTRTFDVTAPSIDAPANFALQGCNGNWPELTANWTDNCSEGGVINGVAGEVVTNGCSQSRVYTFSVTDACGNSSSATTTVTRTFDVTAPSIDAPANFALQGCNGNWPELTANWTDNCSEGGVINGVAGEVVTNGCSQSRVYTFSVTDACGNSSSATTTVTRTFDVTPPTIVAPADYVLEGCNAEWPTVVQANWTDNCSEGGVLNGVAGEVTTDGCSQYRTYSFSVTDDCGNSSSASTVITRFYNESNPVIQPIASYSLQGCNANWPELNTTWTSDCAAGGNITASAGDVMTDGCTQSRVYTFFVSDECGNSATSTTTVTRTFDVTAPSIDAPANFALQGCNGNWPELTANWTDNCSEGGVINGVAGEVVTNGCSQSRVYTFSVTDACGNSSSATTTVTRTFDVTAPSIDAPANFALQGCNGNWPELTANWTDNCSEGGVINGAAGEVMTDGCSQSRVYTFSVTDACGNSSSATTTVTRTFDVTAPSIDAPANFALQGCNGNWPELTANWTDNCSEGGIINGVAGEVVTNECSQSRVYTFSVTDACGNSSSATTTVTRTFDVTAPAIDAPANFALQGCNGNWPELTANWTDNCSEGGIINGVAGEVVTNGCSQSRVYTFSVTDACGNSSSATTTVTRTFDVTAPIIDAPADFSVEDCTDSETEWPTLSASWTDNCSQGGTVWASAGEVMSNGCSQWRVYTFTIVDDCGNPATATTTVTRFFDETAPEITCPANVSVDCYTDVPAADINSVSVSDDCSTVTVTWQGDVEQGDDCAGSITRTYRATDACGNWAECVQIITWADTEAPIFNNIPENLIIECTDEVPDPEVLDITDNCNNFDLIWEDEFPQPEVCQLRTQTMGGWGAPANGNNPGVYRDANFAAAFPNGLTVGCNGGFTLTLTSAAAVQAFLPSGGTPAALTQNWVNPAGSLNNTFAGQITALALSIGFDENDPNFGESDDLLANAVINNGPFSGMTVGAVFAIANDVFGGCSNAYSAAQMTDVLAMINENFVDGTGNLGNLDCEPNFLNECAYTIIRTYTATDACGNSSSITQTIVVTDTTPPTITCAEGGNYECVADVPAADINSVDASDNCNVVTVTLEFENINGDDCSGTVVRIYRATDACGNYAECTQMFTYSDTQAPIFNEEITDISVQCPDDVPPFEECTATDNCDDDVQVWSFESSSAFGEETCVLTTAFGPGVDWSIWLDQLPGVSDYFNFSPAGTMQVYNDGSALITGTVVASNNANQIFNVFIRLENKRNWTDWSALGRSYKDDALVAGDNYLDWDYFELDGNNSFLVGAGDFAGSILNLTHMPANFFYGFQCGLAANNKNANFGMSGWFFYDGYLNGTAVNGVGDVNVDKECEPNNQENVCEYTIDRFWFALDDCGNLASAQQTITVADTEAPEFTMVPADLFLECIDDVPAADVSQLEAEDNCDDNVTITHEGDVQSGDDCEAVIIRTYEAIDECGNFVKHFQTITIVDDEAPVLSGVPADATYSCEEEIPAAANVTATDNCTDDVLVSFNESIIPGNCPQSYVIVRTWSAADNCENSVSATQHITITDLVAPVITACPADASYDCLADVPAANTSLVSATDNCGNVTIVLHSEITDGDECEGTIVRTYRATDECGNFADCVQVITYNDDVAPTFDNLPANVAVSCDNIPAIEDVTASDNCGDATVTVVETMFSGGCVGVIQRIYTATDACGNTATHEQYITLVDTVAPVLANLPADATYECDEEVPAPADVTATDNCDASVIVEFSETTEDGDCPQEYTIIRTWTATDTCENSVSYTQVITITDNTAPVFVWVPEDLTVQCPDDVPAPAELVATDNCDDNVTISFEELEPVEASASISTAIGEGYALSIPTFIPGSQNYAFASDGTFTQFVDGTARLQGSVYSTTYPEKGWNVDIYLKNKAGWDQWNATGGIYVDDNNLVNNDEFINWDFYVIDADQSILTGLGDYDGFYLNISQAAQPLNTGFQVGEVANNRNTNWGMYTRFYTNGFFDGQNVLGWGNIFFDGVQGPELYNECSYDIVRVWTATDACGNSTSVSQTIHVEDTIAPVFTVVPDDLFFACIDDVPAADTSLLDAEDNCSDVTITHEGDLQTGDDCNAVIIRTYEAIDECGNFVKHFQTITVVDNVAPLFTFVPGAIDVECSDAIPVTSAQATDNCGAPMVTYSDSDLMEDECAGYIVRTFTATDDCGNTATATQIINLIDTTAPTFDNAPANMVASCDNIPAIEDVTASDNCGAATVTVVETMFSGGCVGVIQRIFTATDACGNTATHEQYITLVDTIAPVLANLPADASYECDQVIPAPANVTATDNCDASVIVEFSETTEAGDCAQEYTIFRTWTATDTCENSVSYTQVITITDTTAPVFDMEDTEITVSCDTEVQIPSPTATDNCDDEPTMTAASSIALGECANEWTESYSWTATDDCGNSSTVTFTVNYVDEVAPVFTFVPEAISVECDDEVPATSAQATDNCGDVTITYTDSDLLTDNCAGFYVRTFTAVDACGLATTATQIIDIIDTTAPVITACPADASYSCLADVPAANTSLVSATDNCSDVTIVLHSEVTDGDECEGVIVRTYRATDVCGNFTDCVQVINYNDNVAPTFDNAPANMVASCDNIPAIEDVTASDNCGAATVTVVETMFSGGCVGVIQRIFTATDACGNTATHEQYITLVDTIAPVLANLPADASYECDQVIPAPANVTATDNCDASVIVEFSETTEAGDCAQEYTIFRTWSATDTCENSVSYTQVITITDTTAPTFNVQDSEITVACDFVVDVATPVATDNCDSTPTVTVASSSTPGDCPNEWTEVYTWTATDDCGNSSSVSLTINYVDEVAPVFTMVPQAISVECGQAIPVTSAMATDNCGDVTITYADSDLLTDNCAGFYVRTFTAVDECGNSATATQIIDIIDTTAPVITACPADASYDCLADVPAANTALVSATDVCSDVTIVLHSEVTDGDECEGVIVRTYRATDVCGNFSDCVQVITYNDDVAPTFDNAPENMAVSCDNIPAIEDVTASDNCGAATVTVVETMFSGGCVGVIQRIFTATDACGNTATHEQYITLIDTVAPVLHNLPADMDIECSDKMPFVANVTATDNCDSAVDVDFSEVIEAGDCANNYTIIRTWTATDTCDNSVSHTQYINVSDNTAPVFDVQLQNITVACDQVPAAEECTATDNCSDLLVYGFSEVVTEGCPYTITRTWTATDECGNTATQTQVITVVDEVAPVLSMYPADATVSCDNIPAAPAITATDNCDDDLNVSFVQSAFEGCSGQFTRTWSVTDWCNNTTTHVQTITVIDNVAPWFNQSVEDATVECDAIPSVPQVSASDNCDLNVAIAYNEQIVDGDCDGNYTIIRTWIATDDCNNSSSLVQTITVEDTTAPVFVDAPADATYTCDDEIPALEDCIAIDNCSGNITYTSVEYIEGYTGEDGLRECTLTTPFNVIGQPWALWLPNSIGEPQYYYLSEAGGQFTELPNGRAHLTGVAYAHNNPNKRWIIDVYFKDRADWTTWSALGRSYKDDAMVAGNLFETWDYYVMNADSAVLTGDGLYAGANLNLSHMPASFYFGFQVGQAANNRNAADGMSGWFFYNGNWNNADVNGVGDFGFESDCPECDYTITRIWTATDDCGNESVAVQVITVQEGDSNLEGGIAEQQIGRDSGVVLAAWPNPTAHKATINFSVPFGGNVVLEVFNMDGKLIQTLYQGEVMANQEYFYPFDAQSLSNGIYLYKLTTDKASYIDKLMIVK